MKKTKESITKRFRLLDFTWIIWTILFIVVIYFSLPYILQLIDAGPFVLMSGSMRHFDKNQDFFESYWEGRGLPASEIPFRKGIETGDLAVISPASDYKVGDVIAYSRVKGGQRILHRIYMLNSTHFRDIWDRYITEENSKKNITIAVKNGHLMTISDTSRTQNYDLVYQAPAYEGYTSYWVPVSKIEGRVAFVFPKAGLVYEWLNRIKEVQRTKEE